MYHTILLACTDVMYVTMYYIFYHVLCYVHFYVLLLCLFLCTIVFQYLVQNINIVHVVSYDNNDAVFIVQIFCILYIRQRLDKILMWDKNGLTDVAIDVL